MDTSKAIVFGSFSEDEASLFQKAFVEEGKKSFKQNYLQFGSFGSQVDCSQRSHEILSKQACNGVTEKHHLKLNGKSVASLDGECFVPNRGRTSELSTKKQGSSRSHDTKVATANGGDKTSVKLESSDEGAINENSVIKTVDGAKSVQEFEESDSNLMRGDTIRELNSLSLECNDAVEDPISLTANIPISWATRFGRKAGNGQIYSHGCDKGRPKPGALPETLKTSQGKASGSSLANGSSNASGGTEIATKTWQPRGLINAGNLCFLNATMQALISCVPFFQLLQTLRSRDIPEVGFPTLRAFVEFVAEIEEDKPLDAVQKKNEKAIGGLEVGKPLLPNMFDPVLGKFSPDQPISSSGSPRQEDAQEFLSFVMDRMHGELLQLDGRNLNGSGCSNSSMITVSGDDDWETVGPKNRSAVTRTQSFMESDLSGIFGGQLQSVVKSKGNKASATIQPFMLLHLDIFPESVKTVEDALRLFASPESVEGYRTSTDKEGVVSAKKSVKLQTLSKVLVLHLMRFSYGSTGSRKLHKPLRFNPEITLGREMLVSSTTEGRRYELVATITHHGRDPSKGHYTADTKYSDGQWLHFDDAAVSVVGLNKVLHDQAYVLFYKQR